VRRAEVPGSFALEVVARMDLVDLTRREADVAIRGVRPTHSDFVVCRLGLWPCGLSATKFLAGEGGMEPGDVDFYKVGIITWTEEYALRTKEAIVQVSARLKPNCPQITIR
jgi:DNA-binding transcriptional LysR family regulator